MKHRLAALLAVASPIAAHAVELNTVGALSQTEFRALSEDFGAALSYKPLVPAEGLGLTGFDLGLVVTGTTLKDARLLSKASSNASVPTVLPIPSLRAVKGLPFDIDVGVMYAKATDVDLSLFGGEVRWAFISGNTVLPAVAIRGSYTKLSGVDQLKFDTKGVDLSISKGFLNITPYGGVGKVWVTSTPVGLPTVLEEKFAQTKLFAGVNVNLGINLAFEVDSTGSRTSYGIKGGLRF